MNKNNKKIIGFIYTEKIKDDQIELTYRNKVIDHVFVQNTGQDDFINLSISQKKINIFLFLIIFLMSIFIFRIAYLQIYRGNYFLSVAEGNRIRIQTIKASRGFIYDRNNILLVKNIPNFNIAIIKGDLPKEEPAQNKIISELAGILNIPESDIQTKIDKSSNWQSTIIAENLNYNQAIQLMIYSTANPAVHCEPLAIREYLKPYSLSHVIGYVGKINDEELQNFSDGGYTTDDYIGKTGIEIYYEKILKGINGKKQIEINAKGEAIKTIAETESSAGHSLVLTIDSELQDKAYEAIEKYAEKQDSNGAAAVALDPRNGEILALANWPSFDDNAFITGISFAEYQKLIDDEKKPLFNKTIAGEYPSGSTFKLVIAAAALQEGVITSNTTVNSTGGITIHGYKYPDWKTGGHGITNITKALAESVNTFFYIAGGGTYNEETNEINGGLGIEKIDEYAQKFGLNQKSNIDLPGEKNGLIPTRDWKKQNKGEDWYIGDTYHVSIGQGDVLVTPLQVANYTEVIANNGTLYRPFLLKKELNFNNEVVRENSPQIINQNFIDKNNIAQVQKGMREAVLSGSAIKLNSLSVNVAAKTGTVQHTGEGKDHSWLTAYAPYDNPEIVISVIIEKGGQGTEAALPAVLEILDWYFNR